MGLRRWVFTSFLATILLLTAVSAETTDADSASPAPTPAPGRTQRAPARPSAIIIWRIPLGEM